MAKLIFSEELSIKDFEKYVSGMMQEGIDFLEKELTKIRTNRVHPSLVEDVKISAYGDMMILKNIAVISAADNQTLVVQPFDVALINEIEKALTQEHSLGVTPRNDGKIIKINLPSMSQARRQELIKLSFKHKESALILLRKVRQDILQLAKDAEKSKKISEDLGKRLSKSIQGLLDQHTIKLEQMTNKKEAALNE